MPDNNQAQGGFKSVFGSDSNTGVFGSNPQSPVASSVDQALTGGGTITSASLYGQNGQPQQQRPDMSNLRNIQEWIEADRAQGVTNPIISMMRYQAFMEPMEKQRREDNLRSAFFTLRNPKATDADKLNAYALIEYESNRPGLKETMDWAQEQHQMARDEFGHKKELWPLQMEQARLGLDNTRSIIDNRNFTQRNAVRVGDIMRGFTGQVFPIDKPGNYEDSDLSKTRPELVSAADILNTYARNKFGKGLKVNGGWRSAAHNAEVNGTKTSHHLSGHALDIDASSLSEAELADLQAFAKQIGLNADGDNMYHDKGTGYHMHITLPEGYYLKSVDLGNGKFLTPQMMMGQGNQPTDSGTNTYYIDKAMGEFVANPSGGVDNLAKSLIPKLREFSQKKGANARDELYKYLKNDKRVQGLMENAKNQNEVPDLLNDIVERTIFYAQNGTMKQYGNGDTPPQVTGKSKQEHGGGGSSGFADVMRDTRAYDDYNGQGVYNINDKRTLEPEQEDRYKYAYVRNLWQKGLENLERGRQIK